MMGTIVSTQHPLLWLIQFTSSKTCSWLKRCLEPKPSQEFLLSLEHRRRTTGSCRSLWLYLEYCSKNFQA